MSGASFSKVMIQFVPASFVVGAGMELFMLNTGFYDVALRKEAERRAEAEEEYQARRARIEARRRARQSNSNSNNSGTSRPEKAQAPGLEQVEEAPSLHDQLRSIRSPADGGQPIIATVSEMAGEYDTITCPNERLSFGSGLGLEFNDDSPTPGVAEERTAILSAAAPPGSLGSSDSHPVDIDLQEDNGETPSPLTPVPGVRRSLGLQHGFLAGSSLAPVAGRSPLCCSSPPSILDGVLGVERASLDGGNDTLMNNLSLSSDLIMAAFGDDVTGQDAKINEQHLHQPAEEEGKDSPDFTQPLMEIDVTRVQIFNLLDEAQKMLKIKVVKMIDDTIANTKAEVHQRLEKLLLCLERDSLTRQLKMASCGTAGPASSPTTASSTTTSPVVVDQVNASACTSPPHLPCTPVATVLSPGQGLNIRTGTYFDAPATPSNTGPSFSLGSLSTKGLIDTAIDAAAAATAAAADDDGDDDGDEPLEPSPSITSAAAIPTHTASGVQTDGITLDHTLNPAAVAEPPAHAINGDPSPTACIVNQAAVSIASYPMATPAALPFMINLLSPTNTAPAAVAIDEQMEGTSPTAPDTPAAAGVPTVREALEGAPAPDAVANQFTTDTDGGASPDRNAGPFDDDARSIASSTPSVSAVAPTTVDLASPTSTTAATVAPSSHNLSTAAVDSSRTAIRGPPHSSAGTHQGVGGHEEDRTEAGFPHHRHRRRRAVPIAISPTPAGKMKMVSLSTRSTLQTTPGCERAVKGSSSTPSSPSPAVNKRPPMRFGGASEAISSPPRALPEGKAHKRASLDDGGAATKPLGASPVNTVPVTAGRRNIIAAAAAAAAAAVAAGHEFSSPLLGKVMASSGEASSVPAVALPRSPLEVVALNGVGSASAAGFVGSSHGAEQHPNKGGVPSSRSRAPANRRAAGSTRSTFGRDIGKENVGSDTAARSSHQPQVRSGKTIAGMAAAAEAKAVAATGTGTTTGRRSARNIRASEQLASEQKVARTAAVIPRTTRPTTASRRATVDPDKTGVGQRRRSARIARIAEASGNDPSSGAPRKPKSTYRPRWR
eukprot:g19864.t1